MKLEIRLPKKVNSIIKTIQASGFEAYAVGGCVRDSILGRSPEDWDITTSASPLEVKKLFERTFDTGIAHGTVTVLLEKEGFEVTTYRIDGEYEDSRHPKEVSFTGELKEDLRRRDFTMNAMAYNEDEGLVDVFGGREDLRKGIIRCVGDPMERFGEDALRMLRAVRFAAQLGFEIEETTKDAICRQAPTLANISAERIQAEFVKLLISPHPERLAEACKLGITEVVLPEFQETVDIEAMERIRADKVLRLTMLLCGGGLEQARKMMRRLKFDNDTTKKVCMLVQCYDCPLTATEEFVRHLMYRMGKDMFPLFLEVRKAAQGGQDRTEKEVLTKLEECYLEVVRQGQCTSLKELQLTGSDLIALGMKPGKQLGEVLNELLMEVLHNPQLNQKEKLLLRAKERIN